MSFTFTVRSPAPPDYARVLSELGLEGVRPDPLEDHHPEDGPWPESHVHHFYRHGLSTRGCEIEYDNNVFSVRINTLGSPEDYDLGMRFIEVVAEFAGKKIRTEDDIIISRHDLRSKYDSEWVRQTNLFGLDAFVKMIKEGDGSDWQLIGCIRPFHLGPRLLGELENAGPMHELLERLMAHYRCVQYIDDNDRYYAAEVMAMKKTEDGEEIRLAVFGPGVDYLFPTVPFLVLVGENEGDAPIRVPIEILPMLAEGRWQWLDEKQTLVEHIPANEWPRILSIARLHAVD
jgi:hypothetical protein